MKNITFKIDNFLSRKELKEGIEKLVQSVIEETYEMDVSYYLMPEGVEISQWDEPKFNQRALADWDYLAKSLEFMDDDGGNPDTAKAAIEGLESCIKKIKELYLKE